MIRLIIYEIKLYVDQHKVWTMLTGARYKV